MADLSNWFEEELLDEINKFRTAYGDEKINKDGIDGAFNSFLEKESFIPHGAIEFRQDDLDFLFYAPTKDYGNNYIMSEEKWETFKTAVDNYYIMTKANNLNIKSYNKRRALEERVSWWHEKYGDRFNEPRILNKTPDKTYHDSHYDSGYVYLLKGSDCYKIGKSKEPDKRYKTLEVKLPFKVKLIHKVYANEYSKLEKFLHNRFSDKNINGEWFDLDQDDIKYIKNLVGDEYVQNE